MKNLPKILQVFLCDSYSKARHARDLNNEHVLKYRIVFWALGWIFVFLLPLFPLLYLLEQHLKFMRNAFGWCSSTLSGVFFAASLVGDLITVGGIVNFTVCMRC